MRASRNSDEGSDGSSVSLPFLAFPKTKGEKENMCITFLEPMLKRDFCIGRCIFGPGIEPGIRIASHLPTESEIFFKATDKIPRRAFAVSG